MSALDDMAEVLAAHQYDREKAVCTCSNEVQVGLRCDKQTHAEHVADVLAKAGYGKLADAWDRGMRDMTKLMAAGPGYEMGNPYRSES